MLGRRESENIRVGEPLEVSVLVESQHVVALAPQPSPNALPGDMCIQQQAMRYEATSNVGYLSRSSSRGMLFSAIA